MWNTAFQKYFVIACISWSQLNGAWLAAVATAKDVDGGRSEQVMVVAVAAATVVVGCIGGNRPAQTL